MKNYQPRIADALLRRKLEGKGAVLIEGAKWCGKTTTAEQLAQSILYLSDPEKSQQYLDMASLAPRKLLEGKTPRLLDEWQLAPQLWDTVRFEVDHRDGLGLFILTGSTVPPSAAVLHHTGTGRIARLKMRPMSLFESGESRGEISLGKLFAEDVAPTATNSLSLEELAFLVCRGGWPLATQLRQTVALDQAFDYCDAVIHSDVSRIDNVAKAPERVRRLMQSYARLQGTQAATTVIRADMRANDKAVLSQDTIHSYLAALA